MNFKFVPLIIPIVLAACANSAPPVYDPTLEPETLTERETEAQIYSVIKLSRYTWSLMSDEERNSVLDHNCVFIKRNPEAAPPGFNVDDCGIDSAVAQPNFGGQVLPRR